MRRHPDFRRPRPHNSLGNIAATAIAMLLGIVVVGIFLGFLLAFLSAAHARDDGRYAQSPLRSWFDGLASKKGLCCSFADGATVQDVDWKTEGGKYQVRIDGQWLTVPDDAVVDVPNRFGRPVVWPYKGDHGETLIRCFMAGTLS